MNRIVLALCATLFASAPALADGCATSSVPDIEVKLPDIDMVVETATNVASKAPWPKTMETSLGPGWTINGLTLVRPLVTSQMHTSDRKSGGRPCVRATKAVLTFAFAAPARIYVSDKYRPDSCEYQSILGHEHQHVGIHLNMRAAYAPVFRKNIQTALASGASGATVEEASQALQARLSTAIDKGIQEFQAITAKHNAQIDTTESYLALQAGCDEW